MPGRGTQCRPPNSSPHRPGCGGFRRSSSWSWRRSAPSSKFRSALIERRMGDLTVFVRTAWAVRSGEDLYDVADEKGFHYQYAPLLAILMTPLADPPAGVDRSWVLPYQVTVAVWYVLNVLFLAIAVHWLASALERSVGEPAGRPRATALVAAAPGAWCWPACR